MNNYAVSVRKAVLMPDFSTALFVRNRDIASNKYGRNKNERQVRKHHMKPCFL